MNIEEYKKRVQEDFIKRFPAFYAYRLGGKAIDLNEKGLVEVVNQLEHCELEIIDFISEKLSKDFILTFLKNKQYSCVKHVSCEECAISLLNIEFK